MMPTTTVTVEHDGTTYSGQIMTVKSTAITYEDHGIMSAWLHCEYPGGGIGVGGYTLDTPLPRGDDGEWRGRVGTAYGLDHIAQIIKTVGVHSWEKLTGQPVIVLFPEGRNLLGSTALGIASLDGRRVLDLKKHAEEWLACEGVSA